MRAGLEAAARVLCQDAEALGGPCGPCIEEAAAVLRAAGVGVSAADVTEVLQPALMDVRVTQVLAHVELVDTHGAVIDKVDVLHSPAAVEAVYEVRQGMRRYGADAPYADAVRRAASLLGGAL